MTPVKRPSDAFEPLLLEEYRRMAKLPVLPIEVIIKEPPLYECKWLVESWLKKLMISGADVMGTLASVAWIKHGPKIVHVTEEQYQALSRVDIRLELHDFSMPFPAVLVNLPPGKVHQFVLVHRINEDVMSALSVSPDHRNDICTSVRHLDGIFVEDSLEKYDPDCQDVAEETCQSLRVACNMILALSNYGCHLSYIFPAEVEDQRKHVAKGDRPGRSGVRPSDRLKEQPQLLTLSREVKLCHKVTRKEGEGEKTGREMPFHWRRGHWAMQPFGPARSQRKRILRPPTMIRADLLTTDASETITEYHT